MPLRFENCTLDLATREFRRGSELVPLEPQVFDLLVYVIQNRDRVVSKDDLIEAVWGGRIVSESALTTRINAARKALGDSGEEQRLIRTVARKGIRFVGQVTEGEAAAPVETIRSDPPALALPDKPSIAVLPFQNMSGDPEQDYFADGMVEEIITALSRFHWLFVIARNSSFIYKGRAIALKQVARELGVRYVLEGSVRKSGQRVRITGQLIDASTGAHLWADRFDGDLADVFELQDRVAVSVVGAIEPKLQQAEIERASRKPTENLDAYDLFLRALPLFEAMTVSGSDEALRLLKLSIERDPSYALPRAKAANCYAWRANNNWATDRVAEGVEGLRLARTALALSNDDAEILTYTSTAIARFARDLDEGILLIDRALSLNSNSARAWGNSALLRTFAGDTRTAIEHGERALRLSPFDPRRFFFTSTLGIAHFLDGHLDMAVELLNRSTKEQPNYPSSFGFLASALAYLGRLDEAHLAVRRRLELDPHTTIAGLRKRIFYRPHHAQLYLDGLAKAGMPE